jgi:hypothetical protein
VAARYELNEENTTSKDHRVNLELMDKSKKEEIANTFFRFFYKP